MNSLDPQSLGMKRIQLILERHSDLRYLLHLTIKSIPHLSDAYVLMTVVNFSFITVYV